MKWGAPLSTAPDDCTGRRNLEYRHRDPDSIPERSFEVHPFSIPERYFAGVICNCTS
jgi:hypothetical protein